MKALDDFKDEVAQQNGLGYDNWKHMVEALGVGFIELDMIIERLEMASELYTKYLLIEFMKYLGMSESKEGKTYEEIYEDFLEKQ